METLFCYIILFIYTNIWEIELWMTSANSVVSEDIDGTCRTEGDVLENSVALVADRGQVFK